MTTRQKAYIHLIKRPIGFFGALMAIIVTSPILLGTIVLLFFANKHGFKGIFFTQNRPGKDERLFNVIKFKSMTDEIGADGNLLPDEKRLTKVGQFVRSTSIDELPQLFNILKGDMAFIGPRPLLVQYLPLYSPEQHRRHEVTPGISGWAQVNGRNLCKLSKKFEYDVWYVDHISLATDIRIFSMTVANVFGRKNVGAGAGNMKEVDDLHFMDRLIELRKNGYKY